MLETLLDAMPGFQAVGELRFFWQQLADGNRSCRCGAALSDCPFWNHVIAEARNKAGVDIEAVAKLAERFERTRSLPFRSVLRRAQPAAYQRLTDANAALYAAVWRAGEDAVLVDASKSPAHLLTLLDTGGVDIRVLHLVA